MSVLNNFRESLIRDATRYLSAADDEAWESHVGEVPKGHSVGELAHVICEKAVASEIGHDCLPELLEIIAEAIRRRLAEAKNGAGCARR